jgi:hypothetical protein
VEEEEEEEEDEEEEEKEEDGGENGDDSHADGSLAVPSSALGPQLPYTPCTDPNYLETFNGITTCQVCAVLAVKDIIVLRLTRRAGFIVTHVAQVAWSQRRQRPQ